MFKSVIERQRAGRLGAGMWVSFAVHAALFAAVLFISGQPKEEVKVDEPIITFRPPQVKKGNPAPAAPKAVATVQPKRPRRDRSRITPPTQVQPLPPEPVAAPEPVDDSSSSTGDTGDGGEACEGCHPDGDPNGVIGVPLIPGLVGPGGTGTEVLPFGQGMTQPVLMDGKPIEYTNQARAANVEGTLIAKCVITTEGRVRNCRVIKGLPHMDEAVLDALESRRYRPVTFQGNPVSVSYSFTIRLKLPIR